MSALEAGISASGESPQPQKKAGVLHPGFSTTRKENWLQFQAV